MTKPRTRSVMEEAEAAAAAEEEEARKARRTDGEEGTAEGEATVAPDAAEDSKEPEAAEGSRVPDAAEGSRVPDAAEGSKKPEAAEGSKKPDASEASKEAAADAAQLAVAPYVEDIDQHLRSLEADESRRPTVNYDQEIQGGMMDMDMRAHLVDWLADCSYKVKLLDDTVHLAVSYIDRFLSKSAITEDKLQLLGVTALFVASKYEEVHHYKAKWFSAMTAYKYTKQQVVEMEADILRFLNHKLGDPTVITFLLRFLTSCSGGNRSSAKKLKSMCRYLAELSLLADYSIRFLPSIVAAACLFVAKLTINPKIPPWSLAVQCNTGYKVSDIKDCIHSIHDLQAGRKLLGLKSIRTSFRACRKLLHQKKSRRLSSGMSSM